MRSHLKLCYHGVLALFQWGQVQSSLVVLQPLGTTDDQGSVQHGLIWGQAPTVLFTHLFVLGFFHLLVDVSENIPTAFASTFDFTSLLRVLCCMWEFDMWFALLHPKLTFHDNLLCNNYHWPTSNGHFIIYGCNWLQLMWKHYISLLLMLCRCKMCETGLRVVHANFGSYVNSLNKNRPRYICKEINLCFGNNHSGSTTLFLLIKW